MHERHAPKMGETCGVQSRNEAGFAVHLLSKVAGLRVLVCGGWGYANQAMLFGVLDMQAEETGISTIIQGGADGADRLARLWCHTRFCRGENFAADWHSHGKAAGPIRNQRMIDEGKPDLVVAFPGGRGTADMVRRSKAAGVRVIEVAA